MPEPVLMSTIKLEVRTGKFQCDTSIGQFSIYLPLGTSDSLEDLQFTKVSDDENQITIWGQFPDDSDFLVFGTRQKIVKLICKDGIWQEA